jgi:hypothetical protein
MDNKPFPVKLGELKSDLQREAFEKNISLHKYITVILSQRHLEIIEVRVSEHVTVVQKKLLS